MLLLILEKEGGGEGGKGKEKEGEGERRKEREGGRREEVGGRTEGEGGRETNIKALPGCLAASLGLLRRENCSLGMCPDGDWIHNLLVYWAML